MDRKKRGMPEVESASVRSTEEINLCGYASGCVYESVCTCACVCSCVCGCKILGVLIEKYGNQNSIPHPPNHKMRKGVCTAI